MAFNGIRVQFQRRSKCFLGFVVVPQIQFRNTAQGDYVRLPRLGHALVVVHMVEHTFIVLLLQIRVSRQCEHLRMICSHQIRPLEFAQGRFGVLQLHIGSGQQQQAASVVRICLECVLDLDLRSARFTGFQIQFGLL